MMYLLVPAETVSEVKYFPAIASSIEIIKTGDVQLGTHWKPLVETDLKLKSSPNKVLTYSPLDSVLRIAIKTNTHQDDKPVSHHVLVNNSKNQYM